MATKNFVFTAVLMAALLFAGVASATNDNSNASLAEKISALIQQITQLQAKLKVLQAQQNTTGTEWCHTFNANIGVGQKTGNPEIEALKTVLQKEGVYSTTSSEKGYDEALASAVTAFQQKYASEILAPLGLKYGTGYMGVSTRDKLNALYGCKGQNQCNIDSDCPVVTRICPVGLTNVGPNCVNGKCTEQKCVSSAQPSIDHLSKSTAAPGDSITIYGSNLYGVNPVVMYLASNHGVSLATNAFVFDQKGTDATFNIPANAAAGVYGLAVFAKGSQISSNEVSLTITSSSAQPSISVISPNGGETWKVGETHNITWTSVGLTDDVVIRISSPSTYAVVATVPATQGFYSWVVGSTRDGYTGPARSDYKIEITDWTNTHVVGTSINYFTIAPANTNQPTITVLSPNGGEGWKIGETHNITWTSSNLPAYDTVNVMLYSYDSKGNNIGGQMLNGTVNSQGTPLNSNSYAWTIPSTITPGNKFKIGINDNNTSSAINGLSLSYFTIGAAQ